MSLQMQERLEREYNLDLVTTAPTVVYKCMVSDGTELTVNSPADLPEATKRDSISEPYVRWVVWQCWCVCFWGGGCLGIRVVRSIELC